MNTATAPLARHLSITRLLNAPRELVFQAWTDPKHLAQWCHLDVLDTTRMEIDAKVGGAWLIHLRGKDGMECIIHRVFSEVTPPARLVFTEKCRADGKLILDGLLTVSFEDEGGKTRLTIACELATTPFDAENQQGWNNGWGTILDKLAVHLTKH